jgi:diamine N-acetyltransferase
MKAVKLREAGESGIPEVAALAERIWNQHYPSIISRQQIDYMLSLMYSHESLREQIRVKNQLFYFVLTGDHTVGFIAIDRKDKGEIFISKFYIDQEMAGQGIGTAAFRELLQLHGPSRVTLTVNRQNVTAINFYFRNGFRIERVADFDIGNGFVMNDFVMVWQPQRSPGGRAG